MDIGPVEYIVIDFPGNQFNGDILPALQELVDSNTVHILDLVVVSKDAEGRLTILELDEVGDLEVVFQGLNYEVRGLLNEDDIAMLGDELPDNSTAALLVWENVWATKFAQAVRAANGMIVDYARIPHDIVRAAIDYVEA
jgi:uncharacterized membrane protein